MKIIYVDFGNQSWSPMIAAVALRQIETVAPEAEPRVESAGVHRDLRHGYPAAPHWEALKGETHIDLSDHRSRWVGSLDLTEFDVIVLRDRLVFKMVEHQLMQQGVGDRVQFSGCRDPFGKDINAYRDCYEAIMEEVAVFVEDKIPHPS